MTSVVIAGLTVAFNGISACTGVDLEIPAGGICVIVGRSGSGKTTLLRALNRLNECFAGCRTQGRVTLRFAGQDPVEAYDTRTDVEWLRRHVGMVFQSPNVLPVSIGRNLLMPLRLVAAISGSEAQDRMRQALQGVGLWNEVSDRLEHPAATLSGGQQQRLCLARTLALEPELLLLDEPTASVDYRSARNNRRSAARPGAAPHRGHGFAQPVADPSSGPAGGADARRPSGQCLETGCGKGGRCGQGAGCAVGGSFLEHSVTCGKVRPVAGSRRAGSGEV